MDTITIAGLLLGTVGVGLAIYWRLKDSKKDLSLSPENRAVPYKDLACLEGKCTGKLCLTKTLHALKCTTCLQMYGVDKDGHIYYGKKDKPAEEIMLGHVVEAKSIGEKNAEAIIDAGTN